MARSYLPSKVSEIVAIRRKDLHKVSVFHLFVVLVSELITGLGKGYHLYLLHNHGHIHLYVLLHPG